MTLPLIDGVAALIVFGGTLLATVLRSGWRELALTGRALRRAVAAPYSAEAAKAELAGQVHAIRQDGLLKAPPAHARDRALDEGLAALVHERSLGALAATLERHKAARQVASDTAVRVLAQAAELAPVFGMAGTLVALSRLAGHMLDQGEAITGAIGLAVVTTLYGILAANLLLAPLARLVERAAAREEAARQEVADWLARQVADGLPRLRGPRLHHASNHVPVQADAA